MVLWVPHVRWVGVVPTRVLAGERPINLICEGEKVVTKRQPRTTKLGINGEGGDWLKGNSVVLTL